MTWTETSPDVFSPSWFWAVQEYCPESEDRMELRTNCWSVLTTDWLFFFLQVYLAAGLASLLQLRVTERPSVIWPEDISLAERNSGASGGKNTKLSIIIIWIFYWLPEERRQEYKGFCHSLLGSNTKDFQQRLWATTGGLVLERTSNLFGKIYICFISWKNIDTTITKNILQLQYDQKLTESDV